MGPRKREVHFRGIVPAVPTMCAQDGKIDEAGQRDVVSFCIEKGAHGIACLLLAGEFYKFSDAERKKVTEWVVSEASGKVPVLVGISHTGTLPAVYLGKHAQEIGADGVIVTPPYHANFVHEASKSLLRHYGAVAAQVDLPIMIQDFASKGGVQLSPKDLVGIVSEYPNIRYIKVEGEGHLEKMRRVMEATQGRIGVFGGMAGRHIMEELKLGSSGSIPGAELVDIHVALYEAARRNDQAGAKRIVSLLQPYLDFFVRNFESFVEAEKEVLRYRGVISNTAVRQPAIPLGARRRAELLRIVRKMNIDSAMLRRLR